MFKSVLFKKYRLQKTIFHASFEFKSYKVTHEFLSLTNSSVSLQHTLQFPECNSFEIFIICLECFMFLNIFTIYFEQKCC